MKEVKTENIVTIDLLKEAFSHALRPLELSSEQVDEVFWHTYESENLESILGVVNIEAYLSDFEKIHKSMHDVIYVIGGKEMCFKTDSRISIDVYNYVKSHLVQ